MKKLKTQKGITLIALVITIIVLLILAGVALSALMGDSGILTNAEKAKENTSKSNAREQLGLAVQQALIEGRDTGTVSRDSLNAELTQLVGTEGEDYTISEGEGPWTVTIGVHEFTVGTNGKIEEDDDSTPPAAGGTYASAPKDAETGVLSEGNATFIIDGYTAVIPQGFKVIDGSEGEQSIAKGLVIQDALGNEFVWIPVETKKDENSNDIDDGIEAFQARYNSTDTEPYESGYTNEDGSTEEDDYNKMRASVVENKGFYIGRYEAGIAIDPEKDNSRKPSQVNPEQTVVIQKGAYPYNVVAWGKDMSDYTTPIKYDFEWYEYNEETGLDQGHGAVYLSKNLLKGQTTGATSTLCYGVQWDAMLNFISANTDKDINSSTAWGNYKDNKFTFTGKYSEDYGETWQDGTNKEKPSNKSWLLSTGASDTNQAQNIYDVAGNLFEWTMEAFSPDNRILRGGSYGYDGTYMPASIRDFGGSSYFPFFCNGDFGFRPTLYITN